MNPARISFPVLSLIVLLNAGDGAEPRTDWPQWRGPNRDGVSAETNLLKRWSRPPQLKWTADGLGMAYSTVAVRDGRVLTTGKDERSNVVVHAFDLKTGKRLWAKQIDKTTRTPCSTPTIDSQFVYALSPDGDLCCLDVEQGNITWRVHYIEDFQGKMQSGRGFGESPLIDGNTVVCTPGGAEHALVKLDKQTGKQVWSSRVPKLGERGGDGVGFSSIVMTEAVGIRQYVQLLGRGLVGVAADDGRFLWGYNKIANRTANIPTPIVHNEFVFAANGYNAGSVLLKLSKGGASGVTAQEMYFLRGSRFQNHHGGIILKDKFIYGGHGSNNGLPTCLELSTGKIRWKRRGPGTGSAAVVCADGHLYFRYQDGTVALIEVNNRRYRLKGKFRIPGAANDSWPHPVVTSGLLLLREKDKLFAYQIAKTAN